MCLAIFDMLSMGVCSKRQWESPGRLVQELNVCTVPVQAVLTACCLSPLSGFESRPGHVRKLPVTWG